MPTTRPRVPGWHPDPEDPTSLRHWDGKRWGPERRPRPSWAPGPRPSDLATAPGGPPGGGGPVPTPASRRRWYLLAGAAVLIALLVISVPAWLGSGPTIPPRTVSDASFTTRADKVCAAALPGLRSDRPQSREDNGTPAAFAARIERAADGLMTVVTDLRRIPAVTSSDGAEVDRWLDGWDTYVAVGHRYADAIRAQDQERSKDLSAQGRALAKRVYLFAVANGMPSCTF